MRLPGLDPSMVLEQDGDAVAAHRFFRQRARTLGKKVAVFQPDGLFVEAGIADHRR